MPMEYSTYPGPGLLDGIDNSNMNVPPNWVCDNHIVLIVLGLGDAFSYESVAHWAKRQYIHWYPLRRTYR
jgi:hypothetical protein